VRERERERSDRSAEQKTFLKIEIHSAIHVRITRDHLLTSDLSSKKRSREREREIREIRQISRANNIFKNTDTFCNNT
jgi:hypothetical protein